MAPYVTPLGYLRVLCGTVILIFMVQLLVNVARKTR